MRYFIIAIAMLALTLSGCSEMSMISGSHSVQALSAELENKQVVTTVTKQIGTDESFILYWELYGDDKLIESRLEPIALSSSVKSMEFRQDIPGSPKALDLRYYWSNPESSVNCPSGRIFSYTVSGVLQKLPDRVCNYKWEFYQNVHTEKRYGMYHDFNKDIAYSQWLSEPGFVSKSLKYSSSVITVPGDIIEVPVFSFDGFFQWLHEVLGI